MRNPATSEEVSRFQDSKTADVEAATDAQGDWDDTPGPERGAVLQRTSEALAERKDSATEALVREEGKTLSEASGEVQRAIDIFAYYGQKARDLAGVVKSPTTRD